MLTERYNTKENKSELKQWQSASIDEIINHILKHYHANLRKDIQRLKEIMTFCENCTHDDHKAMASLAQFFETLSEELLEHIKLEEQNDFPLMLAYANKKPVKDINAILEHFAIEHDEVGEELLGRQFGILESLLPINDSPQIHDIKKLICQFGYNLDDHIFLERHILLPKITNLQKNG